MKEITLSMKEQEKLAIIIRYADGAITGNDAAKLLGITVRQVLCRKKKWKNSSYHITRETSCLPLFRR